MSARPEVPSAMMAGEAAEYPAGSPSDAVTAAEEVAAAATTEEAEATVPAARVKTPLLSVASAEL